jgi:hypothetical protein
MKDTGSIILRNSLRTPDGTEIVSRDRHEFTSHTDANGNRYMVDGGSEYLRRSANGDEVDTSILFFANCPFSTVREHMTWGSYGPNGDQPKRILKLGEMDTDHIEAILKTQDHIGKFYRAAFLMELALREKA